MATWDNHTVTNEHILPYVDSSTAPPDIKAALETLPFERNVFKLLANGTVSFKPFMALLTTMWSKDRKIRSTEWQLAVLRTAATLDAPYEWDVNEPVARVFGMSEEQFAAIRNTERGDLPADLFTERQRLVGRFIDQLSGKNRVDVDLMTEVKGKFGDEEIMELFYTHGVYSLLARMMNSCRIDYDPPIPGLEDTLRKYNADAIEKEKAYKG
ncbi:AhpD-like protein [Coniochaeta sp. 2T2.1]|nr:AhpD-like protein [Coniochaeta sp. 2T2.1]